MGLFIKRNVTNILEVPINIFVQFISLGLKVNRDDNQLKLEADLSDGLVFNKAGQIVVDQEIDESKSSIMTTQSSSSLSIDERKITLTKFLDDYKICRNKSGIIIDFKHLGTREEKDDVIIADIGYVSALSKPNRIPTSEKPSFYKK